jgi:alkanesulfonate monooxygenase SsuD/methylene tetrahydromethanopterin reductase-like flavin-dependent oxidoreductase (luciferase family)
MMGVMAAARTKRLRIRTAVSLAPFYNPLRLAEEVALLDVLSGGRVNWGAGRGFERSEFKAFGIPGEESASRFHETVDIVLKAWTNGQCLVPVSDPPCAILIEVRMRRLLGTFPRPKLPKSTRIAVMLAWQLRRSQIALANSRGSTLGFSHRSERHAISRRRRAAGQGRWPIWLQPKRNGCLQTTKRINKPSGGSR